MLCSKNSCTGCLSCQNICPKNAIQVITDKQGFGNLKSTTKNVLIVDYAINLAPYTPTT